jgi:hypothetical protein
MASKSPKLPPESTGSAPLSAPKAVHVVLFGDDWVVRVGRRVQSTFATRHEAVRAAMPFAREHSARLFVHYAGGEIREASTAPEDEMLLDIWQVIRMRGLLTVD